MGLEENIVAQFENNDFAKYDYYKNNISKNSDVRNIVLPPDVEPQERLSIASQMDNIERKINMIFEQLAALNRFVDKIKS